MVDCKYINLNNQSFCLVFFFFSGEGKTMFENVRIVAAIPARWPFHPSYMHTFGNFFCFSLNCFY